MNKTKIGRPVDLSGINICEIENGCIQINFHERY